MEPRLERIQAPPAGPADPATAVTWCEVFDLVYFSPQATFGGHITLVRWPVAQRAWFWSAVLGGDHALVSVVDTDARLPSDSLELRSNGLWADQNCERAFEHWSYGLEAFAVATDAPDQAARHDAEPGAGGHVELWGERVPLGHDLEWEVDGPTVTEVASSPGAGYSQPGIVHGEVVVGTTTYELDGFGVRSHRWGPRIPPVGAVARRGEAGEWRVEELGFDESGTDELRIDDGPDSSQLGASGTAPTTRSPVRWADPAGQALYAIDRWLQAGRPGTAPGWSQRIRRAERRGR